MKNVRQKYRKLLGFTIAEVLIVISVIAILASIVALVYPGYQMRARNAERKSDLGQVAAALGTYAIQKNNYVGLASGCGINGNGNGWLSASTAQIATYPKSILTCLQEANLVSAGTFIDPSGCLWASGGSCGSTGGLVQAYMKATCTKNSVNVTYLFAYLESEPQKVAEVDALCDTGSVSGFDTTTQRWGTRFGMNYYIKVR